jgi:hypothetical protein
MSTSKVKSFSQHHQPADRLSILFHNLMFRVPVGRFVGATLGVKLHSQKHFLLRRGPAKAGDFIHACAGIELEQKFLVFRAEWPQ